MGGSVVVFDKSSGANFTRGKKRMRGDIIKGPEIKKYNCLAGSNNYTAYDFTNLIRSPAPTVSAFAPLIFSWPNLGSSVAQRIGNRINLLGFRMKGWLTLSATQLKMIRWRFVLVRLDMPTGNLNFDQAAYLSQWLNSSPEVPSTTFNQEEYESFSRHNFYKKFRDVDNKSFKTKVIASGTLPATTEYNKLHIALAGTTGQNATYLQSRADNVSYVMGLQSGNMGYIPIDVTVKLNDTVDCTTNNRRYYLVFEADCGYGWTEEGVPSKDHVGVIANVYCRGYYTDE